jgi:hypothetical protein
MTENQNNWPMPKSWHGMTTAQRDYGRQIIQLAGLYSSAVIIGDRTDPESLTTASGFLIGFDERVFLVTNSHVMQAYRETLGKWPNARFQFFDTVFEPNIVDEDRSERVDLAVLDVSGIDFTPKTESYWKSSASELQILCPQKWPTAPPKPGESTVSVGWPGKMRSENNGDLEMAAFPMLGQFVGDLQQTSFTITFDREFWIDTDFSPDNPILQETELGGISGSPVFAMHRGVAQIELVGIVKGYGELYDTLYCARADLIGRDGKIESERF